MDIVSTELEKIKLDRIEDAIEDIRKGKVVIVVDDEDRENEGDFICAAECITPSIINFMATHGRGLICAPIEEDRAQELSLDLMVNDNTSLHETAFTISVDLIGNGCTTGISTHDRAKTVKALVDPNMKAGDFARPGHIFPLKAKKGGVLRRTGHTEATIDLARLAGYYPAGVLVEILNEDGTMARLPQLVGIAKHHDLRIISIKDLVAYRMSKERIVEKEGTVTIQSNYGEFDVTVFNQLTTGDKHFAISKGTLNPDSPTIVRVHSDTETGDILGMVFDDYGIQIQKTLELISKEGSGVLLFIRHGEKGDTILQKLKQLGNIAEVDQKQNEQRDFGVGAQILRAMGVQKIRLVSNNPKKRVGLIGYGLEIIDTIQI